MRIVRDLAQALPAPRSYATIGVFDGVHRGHQQLVAEMATAAHAADRAAAAYTFDPHPATAMGREPPPLLTTLDERAELLSALGLDILVVPPFTPATARTGAEDFASLLVDHLHMVELWAGPDFALGYQREGDIPFLKRVGSQLGFTVRVVEPMTCEGKWVSSSHIRAALRTGDFSWATRCLGRPYRLVGTVTGDSRLLRTTRLPVVTVAVSRRRLIPAVGAYVGLAQAGDLESQPAVAYVESPEGDGCNPRGVEVHLLGVEDGPRDQEMVLDLIARLRGGDELLGYGAWRKVLLDDARKARAVLEAPGVDRELP